MLLPRCLELPLSPPSLSFHHRNSPIPPVLSFTSFKTLKFPLLLSLPSHRSRCSLSFSPTNSTSAFIEPLNHQEEEEEEEEKEKEEIFSDVSAEKDMRFLPSPPLEVKELEELPEQWRRSKIAWLCKELPSHKPATLLRVLNAQRKWINQEDATYVVLHCIRIRENEASYRVYKWMAQQRWYHFDFALATKLTDYLGKDRKFTKCREMFDSIINQGRVPNESTFHILTVAYLSAPVEGCLEEACSIYNRMIQLGGYKPRLSLHNSLFRALISKSGASSKHHLKQAEFIYHNLVTADLEIHADIYAGLIWLHSYQDVIDRERITVLREDMMLEGIEESRDLLLSVMRAYSKIGDREETERTWLKLLKSGCSLPSQAFVYRMELYSKVGEPMRSLEIFKAMKEQVIPTSAAAYQKIIEIMSRAHEIDITESIMDEFVQSGMKPLLPAFFYLLCMYFDLEMHDKLEQTFSKCHTRCCPNRSHYNIYLESLVKTGNLEKAEEIFNEMHMNGTIGANARSCNTILRGYLSSDEYGKAEKIYDIMRQKKYDVEPNSVEKLQHVLSLKRKVVQRRVSMKLDQEQREILIGLLLGGMRIESYEERRNHTIHFEFSENSEIHSVLKMHIQERFYEWLTPSSRSVDGDSEIPNRFSTIAHSYFSFFADQFWMKGRFVVPKLIHRWLSPRVLAYWYMCGGFRILSGDILLKLKTGKRENVERIILSLQAKSLACKVKRKGSVFWIGLQGSNAVGFWEMVEPYVLGSIKEFLTPGGDSMVNGMEESQYNGFNTEADSDEQDSY